MEVCDSVQEAVIKTIPKKKKCKKAKQLSEEALQIAEKRREAKGKGTRNQIANIHWIIQKARDFQKKTSTFALLTTPKPLTVWITTNCAKFLKRW